MSARHRDVLVAALERLNLDLDEDEIEYVASGAVEDDERATTVATDERERRAVRGGGLTSVFADDERADDLRNHLGVV